jgi:7-cyano-7-deazaguanine synthase
MNQNPRVVVLLSGGLDSTTCLAMADQQYGARNGGIEAVSFDYGQKHRAELVAAGAVASYYEIDHTILEVPKVPYQGSHASALIPSDKVEMPHQTYEELAENYGVSPTYVPYRNGTLLSLAAAMATSVSMFHECEAEVWFGAHAEDAHNWAYPDCTPEFIGAMANAIYVGSYHRVRLIAPLQWRSKSEVVAIGLGVEAPFELTLSCYEGTRPACGVCPTCVARLHAFARNEAVDPVPYAQEAIRVDFEASSRAAARRESSGKEAVVTDSATRR